MDTIQKLFQNENCRVIISNYFGEESLHQCTPKEGPQEQPERTTNLPKFPDMHKKHGSQEDLSASGKNS